MSTTLAPERSRRRIRRAERARRGRRRPGRRSRRGERSRRPSAGRRHGGAAHGDQGEPRAARRAPVHGADGGDHRRRPHRHPGAHPADPRQGHAHQRGLQRRASRSTACGVGPARHHRRHACSAARPTSAWSRRPRRCCATCACAPSPTSTGSASPTTTRPSGACSRRGSRATSRPSPGSPQWGAVAWIVNSVVIVGTLVVMAMYSWQLALVTVVVSVPAAAAPARAAAPAAARPTTSLRTRVGQTLSAVSESGDGRRRSSGPTASAAGPAERLDDAIDNQYRAEIRAARYFALHVPARRHVRRRSPSRRSSRSARGTGRAGASTPAQLVACPVPREPAARARSPSSARSSTRPRPPSPAGARCSTCSTSRVDVVEPEPGVELPDRRRSTVARRGPRVRLPRRRPGAARRRRRAPRRHRRRRRRRDRLGQDHLRQAAVPAGRPDRRARSCSAASTCATWRRRRAATRCAWCRRTGSCSTPRVRDNVRMGRDGATDDEVDAAFARARARLVARRPARRPRHRGRRAGREPVGRRAPARRAGPGAARRTPGC